MNETSPAAPMIRRSLEQLALLALLSGALAISFSPIFVRLSELGPIATAFWRIAAALPAFAVWRLIEARQPRPAEPDTPSRNRLMLALAGAFFACDLAAWHWSIKLTSVANATLLSNLTPLFVTPVAWLMFGEHIRPLFVVGMLLSVGGAVLLMGQSFSLSTDYLLGDALGILTAVFYGGYQLTVSRLRIGCSTATIMLWSGVAAALLLWPMAAVSGEGLIAATAYGWTMLLGLALFSHAGGQSLIAYAFAHLPASFSSVALLLQPAAAAVLAWVILAEPLGWLQALGGVVILAGIFIARQASQN
jgi:drug/metabolite transporter (DMT)-like permease